MDAIKENLEMSRRIAGLVASHGGTAYYVGGFVRDRLRGEESKDIDIEVHGIAPKVLEALIDSLGKRINIGKSFGIYSLKHYGIDIAMPRTENKTGSGHRDFEVVVDPFIGTKKAAVRRDFTVNALMQNILTGEIVDHFGGCEDMKKRILRHVNDATFTEDPLRVLRAAQFAARFSFSLAPETVRLCGQIPLASLSKERVAEELYKALLKAERPSVFFSVLRQCDRLDDWFPEVKALIDVSQNPEFHAEGDVWNHTMLVLDEAAKLRKEAKFPKYFMVSALVHDFGKADTTEWINGKIHSYQHEQKGVERAQTFLQRITDEKKLLEYAVNMTLLHMRPNILAANRSAVKKTNAMFDVSVSPEDLILLALADDRGRITSDPQEDASAFLTERLKIYRETMLRPEVTGQDLIKAGLKPEQNFSALLKYAHKLHLSGVDKASALKQTLAEAEKQAGEK